MSALTGIWWVWICVALGLGVIELLAPGFIFLGFSIGAVVMALIVAILPTPLATAVALALFAGLSLAAWVGLRIVFRKQRSDTRFIRHDINDN